MSAPLPPRCPLCTATMQQYAENERVIAFKCAGCGHCYVTGKPQYQAKSS